MNHLAIQQVLERAERAGQDSDYTHFFTLLFCAEALAKTVVLGMVASIADDKERNRYRLEHQLVRAEGVGAWGRVLDDVLTGPASHLLLNEARTEQRELMQQCTVGAWQYESIIELKSALDKLGIESEEVPVKSDLRRWFRLFATLRNKTRGHGATRIDSAASAAIHLSNSIHLIYKHFNLFKRPWAHLHRNMSGKYRVSGITDDTSSFTFLKQVQDKYYKDGIYLYISSPRRINLMQSDAELQDFYFANGSLNGRKYEMLSYYSDDRLDGDGSAFLTPPGVLPPSETQGHGTLIPQGNCFSNAPDVVTEYVSRPKLEDELKNLLLDDKRPIVTLLGRGGIGKTSLALKVIQEVYRENRYEAVVWLSARDVDLHFTGPKSVQPSVLSVDDMSKLYSSLVLTSERTSARDFNPRTFFEQQLQKSDIGPCLFVFDNFETTQNPLEMFNWIDSFIKLPNKALITTRLREFKGDYPVEVSGMEENEARQLVARTATFLSITHLIDSSYLTELVSQSGGHPYVIKVLLGEVARKGQAANVPQLIAGTDDILTALFERTYGALSPCAQRAFLTLSAWNSPVPRLALEAVLIRSTKERNEVEKGIESLLQYSMAELHVSLSDKQDFIFLPLVATVFGRKKLNISTSKAAVQADAEILQMLGASRSDDVHLGLARKLESFIRNIAKRIETGAHYESFAPILEAICQAYNPGWLLIAKWHMEEHTPEAYELAKVELRRFLEGGSPSAETAEAWLILGRACYHTGDRLGEVHAFVERAQIAEVPFHELSNTANKLNHLFRAHGTEIEKEQKSDLVNRILPILHSRISEASGDDLSRMAWLAIHSGQEELAREYVQVGLAQDEGNHHLIKLAERLGVLS